MRLYKQEKITTYVCISPMQPLYLLHGFLTCAARRWAACYLEHSQGGFPGAPQAQLRVLWRICPPLHFIEDCNFYRPKIFLSLKKFITPKFCIKKLWITIKLIFELWVCHITPIREEINLIYDFLIYI